MSESNTKKRPVFLRGKWNHLLFANYEIDPNLLSSQVPTGTRLDSWNGSTFLSLVAFRFSDTRMLGIPTFGWRNFDEINLRFYVRGTEDQKVKNGVVFIKEIVPSWLVSTIARLLYGENYQNKEMHSSIESVPDSSKTLSYEIRESDLTSKFSAFVSNPEKMPTEDSLEGYITEHYWGFAGRNSKKTVEYEVEHPKWAVSKVDNYSITLDFEKFYGDRYSFLSDQKPQSVFYCEGSEIVVRMGKTLKL